MNTFNTHSDACDFIVFPDREPTHAELLAIDLLSLPADVSLPCVPVVMPNAGVEYSSVERLEAGLLAASPTDATSAHTARLMEAYMEGLIAYTHSSLYIFEGYEEEEDVNTFPWSDFTPESGIDQHDWYSFVVEALLSAGYETLGSGYFSLVVSPIATPEIVIKLGLKKEDSGAAYAAFSRNLWTNCAAGVLLYDYEVIRHFPKVLHMERVKPFYVVIMPRYETLWEYDENVRALNAPQVGGWLAHQLLNMPLHHVDGHFGKYKAEFDRQNNIDSYNRNKVRFDIKPEVNKIILAAYEANVNLLTNKTLKIACDMVYSFFNGVATFDVHSENIMVATDGLTKYAVLTDPVSYASY